ncbi:glyoxylate reductase [Cystobasidium minutum MCA 4210]|uniref:glyoxylate reductase n=1 Tax=Cystobasidium minutum MCA 4210 TaxID=1397322 RepID=UPI0034CF1EEF|eukprot:jgi/Rhomi1/100102/CE100101_1906
MLRRFSSVPARALRSQRAMSTKVKVVLTRSLPEQGAKLLKEDDRIDAITWPEDSPCDRQWLLENVKGASGILCMLNDKCDEELIKAAGDKLKVVSSFSAGVDHIALGALKERSVRLGYTPSALTDAVADLTVMLTLMAQRRGGEAMRRVMNGDWPKMPWSPLLLCGPQITNSTVGFLGFGRIAQATLARLLPFQISKALYLGSRPGQPAKEDFYGLVKDQKIPIQPAKNAQELAEKSDILIIGCALTPETKHLVNADFLGRMKETAVIVNIARGPVVDTDALAKALNSGSIFGAGIDVIENEPQIPADHPLAQEPRCVLLPHIGSANTETRSLMAEEAVKNLQAGLFGGSMVNEKTL